MAPLPTPPETTLPPEEQELIRKKAVLADLEAQLAERELELASLLADLAHFEKRYLQTVGRRYALLDELKARLAEARARTNPQSKETRDEARKARAQAQESARAVGEENVGAAPADDATPPPRPNRSPGLRDLYRQAAKLLHPDLTLDGSEREKRHRLMAELNEAYARGDEERIRTILRDWQTSPESVQGDGPGAELVRVIRKIAQVETRLQSIAAEMEQFRQAEFFKLKQTVEDARFNGRDLLKELGHQLDEEILRMRKELEKELHRGRP